MTFSKIHLIAKELRVFRLQVQPRRADIYLGIVLGSNEYHRTFDGDNFSNHVELWHNEIGASELLTKDSVYSRFKTD